LGSCVDTRGGGAAAERQNDESEGVVMKIQAMMASS